LGRRTCSTPTKKSTSEFSGNEHLFFGKSVSALTLGSIALMNTNENLLGWIYLRVVGCFWVGGMKLADPDFHNKSVFKSLLTLMLSALTNTDGNTST